MGTGVLEQQIMQDFAIAIDRRVTVLWRGLPCSGLVRDGLLRLHDC